MISGPPPKEDPVRRNAPVYETSKVEWDGLTRGPELPYLEVIEHGDVQVFEWHERTQEWWGKWRNSPQAMVMHDSDWEQMLETAVLHTRFWNGGLKPTELTNLGKELRSRVAAFGSTFEDRRKLRMSIRTPQDEVAEEARIQQEASSAVNYADRLLKAAANKKP